jgi:hypothetical protein
MYPKAFIHGKTGNQRGDGMKRTVEGIAIIGFVLSLIVHLSSYFGFDFIDRAPIFWLLHVLVFLPFGASIYYARRDPNHAEKNHDQAWRAAPLWLRLAAGLCFAYAIVNIIVCIRGNEGKPVREGDHYSMRDYTGRIHGITDREFHAYQAQVARGFSGHWMAFYLIALIFLVGSDRLSRGTANSMIEKATKSGLTPQNESGR